MASQREVVRGAQLLLQTESPTLGADGIWGRKTETTYTASSDTLRDRVGSFVENAGHSLARIRAAASAMIGGSQRLTEFVAMAKAAGVTGVSLANLAATVQIESRFIAQEENHRYRPGRARERFSALAGLSDGQIRSLVSSGPEAFFETVYGVSTLMGRRQLGNKLVGDGYRYRGRGYIQLTGRSNYEQFQNATGIPVVDQPDLLVTDPRASALAAIWYWRSKVVAKGADKDMVSATRVVNPGSPDVAARVALASRYLSIAA